MMKLFKASLLSIIIATSFNASARTVDLDDVTIEVTTQEVKKGNRIGFPGRQAIIEHMIATGALTQEQVDVQKAQQEANKAELKVLKATGDEEPVEAKKAEIQAANKEQRQQVKQYIEVTPELRSELQQAQQLAKEAKREAEQAKREAQREANEAKRLAQKEANEAKRAAKQATSEAKREAQEAKKEANDSKREAKSQVDEAKQDAKKAANEAKREAKQTQQEATEAKRQAQQEARQAKRDAQCDVRCEL